MIEIVPSILSADFTCLGEEIARVERGGARMLHIDVMDGHFVPNLTLGPPVVKSIRKVTKLQLDVHLMIDNPDQYVGPFVEAGADLISVHQEVSPHLNRTIRMIQSHKVKAGVVINPSTPVAALDEVLEIVDFVLVMSVNPGFGGQQFIPRCLKKVWTLDARRREAGLHYAIEIDGGIGLGNTPDVVRAGCDWLVAGAAVFASPDAEAAVAALRRAAVDADAVQV
jgi:ribulose-phosphate 3-epimerase